VHPVPGGADFLSGSNFSLGVRLRCWQLQRCDNFEPGPTQIGRSNNLFLEENPKPQNPKAG